LRYLVMSFDAFWSDYAYAIASRCHKQAPRTGQTPHRGAGGLAHFLTVDAQGQTGRARRFTSLTSAAACAAGLRFVVE